MPKTFDATLKDLIRDHPADWAVARGIFRRVLAMRESSTYLAILEEGAVAHAHSIILKQGGVRFGDPTEKQAAKLKAIEDLERLDRMAVKLLDAKGWDAVLRVK
jgi:hypothetical protein